MPGAVIQPKSGLVLQGSGSQGDPHEGREAGWAGQGRGEQRFGRGWDTGLYLPWKTDTPNMFHLLTD